MGFVCNSISSIPEVATMHVRMEERLYYKVNPRSCSFLCSGLFRIIQAVRREFEYNLLSKLENELDIQFLQFPDKNETAWMMKWKCKQRYDRYVDQLDKCFG